MAMAFWQAVVKGGKPTAFVPPPENWILHLSQACLPATVPEGARCSVQVKTADQGKGFLRRRRRMRTSRAP